MDKLTDEERELLRETGEGAKALWVIDAQAAVIERVWAVVENCAIHIDVVTMGHLRNALAAAPEHE